MHAAPVPARRGRPPGSKAQVVSDPRALGVHHFAFVRSSLLGLDLREAFDRYLAWGEVTTDFRHVQNRRDALLASIIEAGRHLVSSQPGQADLAQQVDLLRSDVAVKPAVTLPTLDEWAEAEGMDPDAWSEADLLAEYKAAFGLDNADAIEAAEGIRDPAAQRVKALNYLETLLATNPSEVDHLESWFARPVAKCLRNAGLQSLGDLVRFINLHGYRWAVRIKGLGPQRAGQVVTWLRLQFENTTLALTGSVDEPKTKRAALRQERGLVQLQDDDGRLGCFGVGSVAWKELVRMQMTPALNGADGVFRSHMPNTLEATNDLDAVNGVLGKYVEKPHTLRSYRKEAERFLLWCARELKKPLSSVTAPDCIAYRAFLRAVPAHWIQQNPLGRSDTAWAAFRSQPSPASQKQALVILQTIYGGLVNHGYLVANPFKQVMTGFELPKSKMDVRRAFTEAEWNHILWHLQKIKTPKLRVRLHCILELLVTSGLRLDELARARHGDLRIEALPGHEPTWVLAVTGKRGKPREVPLKADVVRLLAGHGSEFMEEDKALEDKKKDALGLIRTLRESVPKWGLREDGQVTAEPLSAKVGVPVTATGIYLVLKRFFRAAARTAANSGLDPARFQKASTHWMRHTFGRQALADGMPIQVVSDWLGHESIDTTTIYSTQELSTKIAALALLQQRVPS